MAGIIPPVFKNKQFVFLWGNQILLQVAFNMSNYTALLILGNKTHSPFIQSQFYTALTLPAFILGFIAGPVVDINSKKKVMLFANGFLAVLFFFYLFTQEQIFPILLLAFLTASVARFFIPAEAAVIPAIVSESELEEANSAFLFTLLGSVLVGYSLAGPVIQLFGGLGGRGEYAPFVISSFALLISFFLCFFIKHGESKKLRIPKDVGFLKVTLKLFWETVMEVKDNKKISLSLLLLIFVELNIGILSVVLLEYVNSYLLLPLTSITYYLILPLIFGLGIGMSVLKFAERQIGIRKSIAIACSIIGILLLMLGVLPHFLSGSLIHLLRIFAILSSILTGISIVIIAVQARTILQVSTPLTMQGRVFSFLDVMVALVTPIPVLSLGFFASRVSLLTTFVMFGLLVVAVAYFGYWMYNRSKRYARIS